MKFKYSEFFLLTKAWKAQTRNENGFIIIGVRSGSSGFKGFTRVHLGSTFPDLTSNLLQFIDKKLDFFIPLRFVPPKVSQTTTNGSLEF